MIARLLGLAAVVAALAAGAVVVNSLLLRTAAAGNDPVGQLTPRAHLPPAPHWMVRPTTGRARDGGADD